jgi:hypothetical protein
VRHPVLTGALVGLGLLLPASGSAQILWDAPPLVSHVTPAGISLFLVSPAGGDVGGLMTFRHEAGPVGMGYRFAISDQQSADPALADDIAVSAGIDVSGFLSRGVEGSEIDVMWWSGAGIGIGSEAVVSLPVGALVGWSGQGGAVILSPYAGGHVALDVSTADNDNIALGGAFDLGLDVVLESGWLIRFGASVGDRDAIAIGFKFAS